MSITVAEKFRGRTGDAFSRDIDYLVTDSDGDLDDAAAIDAVVAASPETWDGLFITNCRITEAISNGMLVVTAQYGEPGGGGGAAPKPIGTVEYEFNFQAESEHVYLSLGTRKYAAAGQTAWDFKGAINVKKVGAEISVEGLDLPAGSPTHVWSYTTASSGLTLAYENLVESMMGCVNNVAFKGRPAGSMRFVACSSQLTQTDKLAIRFGMQYKPNLTNIVVADGAITIGRQDGHELIWGYFDNDVAVVGGNDKGVIKYPRYVYVEQVFRTANFNQLGF